MCSNNIECGLKIRGPPVPTTTNSNTQTPFINTVIRTTLLQPEACCARQLPIEMDNKCSTPRSASIRSHQTQITIPDVSTASVYPITFNVGQENILKYLTITLKNYSHTYVGDVGMILAAPDGTTALLWWSASLGEQAEGITVTLDSHDMTLEPWDGYSAGTFAPSGSDNPDFDYPAPQGTFSSNLNVFNGLCTLGDWRLYIQDFVGGDAGSLFSATLNLYV